MWHIAHPDLLRPQPTQGEVDVTEGSEALKVNTVEKPEQHVGEHENNLRDIELKIEAERIPWQSSSGKHAQYQEGESFAQNHED